MNKIHLIKTITEAFNEVPYPSDERLARAYPVEIEQFIGKQWKEVSFDLIMAKKDDLLDFSVEGFRYYLPAFMIAVIQEPIKSDTLAENLLRFLAPPADEASTYQLVWFKKISSILGDKEKQALVAFFQGYEHILLDTGKTIPKQIALYLQQNIDFWT